MIDEWILRTGLFRQPDFDWLVLVIINFLHDWTECEAYKPALDDPGKQI